MGTTALTPELSRLLGSARSLPDAQVREVADFAEFLGYKRADAGQHELSIASVRRFESEHPDDEWGEDLLNPGSPT
jgi:hypothetical protein